MNRNSLFRFLVFFSPANRQKFAESKTIDGNQMTSTSASFNSRTYGVVSRTEPTFCQTIYTLTVYVKRSSLGMSLYRIIIHTGIIMNYRYLKKIHFATTSLRVFYFKKFSQKRITKLSGSLSNWSLNLYGL